MRNRLIEKTYEWDLSCSPKALWPILSDTARLNEALGMPLYGVSETFDGNSIRRRYGEMLEDGSRVRWEEPLFEWVENGWWRWRRFYQEGPLRETGGILMLMPGTDGGTRVHYTLSVDPKGAMGRILVASGHLKLAARTFEKFSRKVDAHCKKPLGDFYSNAAAARVKKAPQLPEAKGAEAALLTQFAGWLAVAPLADRMNLRSRRLAKCLGVRPSEALRACLLAVRSGDLEMRYRAVCPACRASAIELPKLGAVPALLACRRCGSGYHRDFEGSVEVVFSVAGTTGEEGVYCDSGPKIADHVPVQQNLGAVERRDLTYVLPKGVYSVRAQDGPVSAMFELTKPSGVNIQLTEAGVDVDAIGDACVIENHCKREYTVSIERCEWPDEALPVADLLAEQCFHDLMPDHILADGDSASVGFGIVLGIGDLAQKLSSERDGAVIEREDSYYGLVFTSLKKALASAKTLAKTHPDARFALDCGPLTISTLSGRLHYIGTVPDTARSQCLAGHRGVILTSHRMKEALTDASLPVPDAAERTPA